MPIRQWGQDLPDDNDPGSAWLRLTVPRMRVTLLYLIVMHAVIGFSWTFWPTTPPDAFLTVVTGPAFLLSSLLCVSAYFKAHSRNLAVYAGTSAFASHILRCVSSVAFVINHDRALTSSLFVTIALHLGLGRVLYDMWLSRVMPYVQQLNLEEHRDEA